ncbi:GTPase-activating protein skywalker-like isoform X2 [Tigriopus californicus]|uniref:GTPase-activating protein skywalker-like isoform X2 n=1 Tax=Tigriopus californicus TaxID=6832 RepID=UPI0027DA2E61|nr:GTPase-activating protein skywalker-like isoform X2 [Tigriopus californicus]
MEGVHFPVRGAHGRSDPCHGGYQFQSVVDQTLLAALPDHGDHVGENDGETSTLETSQIPSCLTKSQKSIKMLIRSQHGLSLQREERHHLWMGLYHKREGSESRAIHADVFRDSLQSCFGSKEPHDLPPLPSAVKSSHGNTFCLTAKGQTSVTKILIVFVFNNPDVRYCPILHPLAAVFRHFLSEDTYGFLTSLCSSRHPKYFSQTKQQHEVDWQTVKELNNKYNRPICSELISVVGEDNVDDLFKSWMFWILDYLPFPHVVRIVDCFLAEGQKLLFRCCLSILRQFGKVIRANPSKRQVIQKEGLNSTFIRFCREIPVSPSAILERGFRFRGLSTALIQKSSLQIEINIKAKGLLNHSSKTQNDSGDGFPTSQAFPDKSSSSIISPRKQEVDAQETAKDNFQMFPINNLKSEFLTPGQLSSIWQCIPDRMTTIDPKLVYSTNEHGTSLTTFFKNCEKYEPTIIAIKTTKREVFGAYCSTSWAERKYKDDRGLRQAYFGTGETFLFQIDLRDPSECIIYPWVRKNTQNEDVTLTKAEKHAQELFMSGQTDMISIGGGNGCAIFLDSSLRFGRSEHCETFNNPPLCQGKDFEVSVVEVYGLNLLDL